MAEQTIQSSDVIKAINQDLGALYPNINRTGADVTKGFTRPSFSTSIITVDVTKIAAGYYQYSYPIAIRYFPSDNKQNEVELYAMRDSLIQHFIEQEEIVIEETNVPIEDLEAVIVDQVLTINFNLELFQNQPIKLQGDNESVMEELVM